MTVDRPNIYSYYDPIQFLKDWIEYLKKNKTAFNLHILAKKTGLSISNLSMILSRQRPLTEKTFQKINLHLYLSNDEKKFLNHLRIIDQSQDVEARIGSLNEILRLTKNKNGNSSDYKVFEYLTKWYNVAIFELVNTDGFIADPQSIQKKLIKKVTAADIQKSLDFLTEHGFIKQDGSGKWYQVNSDWDCREGIFKLSLGEFHRQALHLAQISIESVKREDRLIMGQTMALSKSDFETIKKIIQNSIQEMNKANKNSSKKENIYHVEIAAFPLFLADERQEDENEKN